MSVARASEATVGGSRSGTERIRDPDQVALAFGHFDGEAKIGHRGKALFEQGRLDPIRCRLVCLGKEEREEMSRQGACLSGYPEILCPYGGSSYPELLILAPPNHLCY